MNPIEKRFLRTARQDELLQNQVFKGMAFNKAEEFIF